MIIVTVKKTGKILGHRKIRDEVWRHAERLPEKMPHTSPNATRRGAPVGAHIAFNTLLRALPYCGQEERKSSNTTGLVCVVGLHKSNMYTEPRSEMRNLETAYISQAISIIETCDEIGNTFKKEKTIWYIFFSLALRKFPSSFEFWRSRVR